MNLAAPRDLPQFLEPRFGRSPHLSAPNTERERTSPTATTNLRPTHPALRRLAVVLQNAAKALHALHFAGTHRCTAQVCSSLNFFLDLRTW